MERAWNAQLVRSQTSRMCVYLSRAIQSAIPLAATSAPVHGSEGNGRHGGTDLRPFPFLCCRIKHGGAIELPARGSPAAGL